MALFVSVLAILATLLEINLLFCEFVGFIAVRGWVDLINIRVPSEACSHDIFSLIFYCLLLLGLRLGG